MGGKASKSKKAQSEKNGSVGKKKAARKEAVKDTLADELSAVQLPEVILPVTASGKARRASIKGYVDESKELAVKAIASFKKDLDPDKVAALKKECVKICKYGSVYLAAILAAASLMILPEAYFREKTLANTFIGDLDISMMSAEEAQQRIGETAENYLKQPLDFVYGDRTVSLPPQELGIKISTEKTVKALPVSHLAQANTIAILGSYVAPRHISADFVFDRETLLPKLEKELGIAEIRAKDARLVLNEKDFEVAPEANGKKINEMKLRADLEERVGNFKASPITIELEEETPAITTEQIAAQKEQIENLLKKNITLKYQDKETKINLLEHTDAVGLKAKTAVRLGETGLILPYVAQGGEADTFKNEKVQITTIMEAEVIPSKITPYLQENFIKDIEIPTSGVDISRAEDGKIIIEGKGEDGKSVPLSRLIAALNEAINTGASSVQAPVMTEKAPIKISDELKDLGIKEMLATGHSSFYGSSGNRIHNINTGIAKYNGALVKPGEEFSFNALLGEVDAKNGFLPEKVIKKNKAEMEYGGGICQVSTTLYRAALLAGLPITERNPHSWKVNYYGQVLGHGLDATIYLGVSDVKFINDTPAHLLIQSYTDGAHAYFKIYGTSDGRTVALDGPYGGGMHYKWYRIINKNGEEIKETIISNYRPPDVIKPAAAPAPAPAPATSTLT